VTIQHGTTSWYLLTAATCSLRWHRSSTVDQAAGHVRSSGTVEGRSASRPCLCASCGGARDPPLRIRLRDGTAGSARCARISCPRCLWRSPRATCRRTRPYATSTSNSSPSICSPKDPAPHLGFTTSGNAPPHLRSRPTPRRARRASEHGDTERSEELRVPDLSKQGSITGGDETTGTTRRPEREAPRAMGPAARVVQRQQQTDLEARTPCRAESGSASPSLPGTHLLRRRAPTGVGPGERGAHGCGCVLVQYCGGDRRGTRRGSPPACARGRVLGAKFLALADP
jgi:hypothetical protein